MILGTGIGVKSELVRRFLWRTKNAAPRCGAHDCLIIKERNGGAAAMLPVLAAAAAGIHPTTDRPTIVVKHPGRDGGSSSDDDDDRVGRGVNHTPLSVKDGFLARR